MNPDEIRQTITFLRTEADRLEGLLTPPDPFPVGTRVRTVAPTRWFGDQVGTIIPPSPTQYSTSYPYRVLLASGREVPVRESELRLCKPDPSDPQPGDRFRTNYGCTYEILSRIGSTVRLKVLASVSQSEVGREYRWGLHSIRTDTPL